jgi:hypothetical protein
VTFSAVARQAVRKITRAIASAPPSVVLGAAWLVLLVYAYPGFMTQDSADHLREARANFYTDLHPPAMSYLWSVLEYFITGPLLMLVLQSGTFLAGLYLVLRRTFTPRRAAWITAGLFVFPPVFVPFAVIWKDCVMAGFLMLGLAAMFAERRWVRIAGLLALGAATAVRYNAFGATFPIIVLLFEWRTGMHWFKRYAISVVAWLAVTFGSFAFNAAITDREMYPWHSTLALFDIVGTLVHADEELSDEELRTLFDGTDLITKTDILGTMRRLYSPRDFLPIINHKTDAMWGVPINGLVPAPQRQRDAIARAFKEVITSHPFAYVKHRLAVLVEVLCFTRRRPAAAIPPREMRPYHAEQLDLSNTWSRLQRKMSEATWLIYKLTPIFVPWIYLFVSLALLPLTRRHRDMFATIMSGLVFESSLLFLAASPDFRYSHWMIVCTLIAVVSLTARRMRARPATPVAS